MGALARTQLPLRPAGPDTVAALLRWYDTERRELPWRSKPRRKADPYTVWLSEVMLQQTTVKAVIPYFATFLERWPDVHSLAAAKLDDVLTAWAGLGYYARARSLHKCAHIIANKYDGEFPTDERTLQTLPGIGPYTAAAISAIAFQQPATPVDGNIERVVSRLFALDAPLPAAKKELHRLAETLTPKKRAGDFAQAMMDIGADVCTTKRPSCLVCPLQPDCHGYAKGIAEQLPTKPAKQIRPVRKGIAFLALREDGYVLLRRRPPAGLLGGMLEVPSTEWTERTPNKTQALRTAPVQANWWPITAQVHHTFTHFKLELTVYRTIVDKDSELTLWADAERCQWVKRSKLDHQALPSVMKKVIALALNET